MTENEIAAVVMDASFEIHRELGPGLLESVYEVVLAKEVERRGLEVRRQVPVPIVFRGFKFDEGYRADLIVQDLVLVEIKSVDALQPVHYKQVLTYIRLKEVRLGLLINFGAGLMKDGFKRVANGISDPGSGPIHLKGEP